MCQLSAHWLIQAKNNISFIYCIWPESDDLAYFFILFCIAWTWNAEKNENLAQTKKISYHYTVPIDDK